MGIRCGLGAVYLHTVQELQCKNRNAECGMGGGGGQGRRRRRRGFMNPDVVGEEI